ncbi:DUF2299 family protein [Natronomonas salina]|uniref:DUF2299 family protein n=1 Tax=Natronomonas salina TaxID=1710540 RepID=UPI001BA4F17D|nr:DUF2299 family protein [Natronomonas salina]
MTTHVSEDQVRWWLDDSAVQDVTAHAGEETEFNLQVTLSRLPIHLIKERPDDPVRVVGRSGFDTDRAKRMLREEESRTELLSQLGPVLATTPGFYTFLDEDSTACELRHAETLQIEHRIYPDEATQQRLMDSVMDIATGMRYVQNVLAATHPGVPPEEDDVEEIEPHDPGDAGDDAEPGDDAD